MKIATSILTPFSFMSKSKPDKLSADAASDAPSEGHAASDAPAGMPLPPVASGNAVSPAVPKLRLPSVSPSPDVVPRMLRYGTESPRDLPAQARPGAETPGTALSQKKQALSQAHRLRGTSLTPVPRAEAPLKENAAPVPMGTTVPPNKQGQPLPPLPSKVIDGEPQSGAHTAAPAAGGADTELRRDISGVFEKARLVLAQRIASGMSQRALDRSREGLGASLPGSLVGSLAASAASTPRGQPRALAGQDLASARSNPGVLSSFEGLGTSVDPAMWAETPRLPGDPIEEKLLMREPLLGPAPHTYGSAVGLPPKSLRSRSCPPLQSLPSPHEAPSSSVWKFSVQDHKLTS